MKRIRNTYINVSAVNYSTQPVINTGSSYTAVESCKLWVYSPLSYADAKKQIARLAAQYNLPIRRRVNQFDPTIITYEISGFLD